MKFYYRPHSNAGVGPDKFTGSDRNGGLKRSYTVLHHGHGRSSSSRDGSAGSSGGSNHKPPLPKLSSPVISTTQNTTNVNLNSNHRYAELWNFYWDIMFLHGDFVRI